MSEEEEFDTQSSLILKGQNASLFSEIRTFYVDIDKRPDERLLSDLDELMAMPSAKYNLVEMVLQKRLRNADASLKARYSTRLSQVKTSGDDEVANRCDKLLA